MKKLIVSLILSLSLFTQSAWSAITFDGATGSVAITNKLTDSTFAISMWLYMPSVPSSASLYPFGNGKFSSNGWLISFTTTNGTIDFIHVGVSDNNITTGAWTTNVWHHLVISWNGSTQQTLYWDGVNKGTSGSDGIVANTNTTNIGVNGDNTGHWNGTITEIFYYNTTLTSGNVATLYGNGHPARGVGTGISGLVAYWPMNDGTSGSAANATVADNKGSNNGTAFATGVTWSTLDNSIFNATTTTINNGTIKNGTIY